MASPSIPALLSIGLLACGGGGGGGGDDDDVPGDSQPATTRTGFLFIQSFTAEQPPGTIVRGGTASAGFSDVADDCAREVIGACTISSCGAFASFADAGTVTITGGSQPVTLTPGVDHQYAPLTVQQQTLFADGANLGFAAAGGMVPAFDDSVTAPTRATITSPVEPPAQNPTLTINRAQAFSIGWSGGGSGQIQVSLFDGGFAQNVQCRFAASAGSGTIPTEVLGKLGPGSGSFAMAAIAESTVVAGDWSVFVQAFVNAVWVDESIVSGPLTLQ